MITYGEAMRAAREQHKFTLRTLAAMSDVTYGQIGHYERGERMPNLPNLVALADALNISIDEYIGRSKYGKTEKDLG